MVDQRKVLNVIVGILELFLQISNLLLLVVHDDHLGVHILGWQVRDLGCSASIVQCAQILLKVSVRRRETCHHERVGITSQTLLEQACELGLSIRNDSLVTFLLGFGQLRYHPSQHHQ